MKTELDIYVEMLQEKGYVISNSCEFGIPNPLNLIQEITIYLPYIVHIKFDPVDGRVIDDLKIDSSAKTQQFKELNNEFKQKLREYNINQVLSNELK